MFFKFLFAVIYLLGTIHMFGAFTHMVAEHDKNYSIAFVTGASVFWPVSVLYGLTIPVQNVIMEQFPVIEKEDLPE